MHKLYHAGYQKWGIDAFMGALLTNGVQVLVDIRAVPYSRQTAWDQSKLRAALAGVGIEYAWRQPLGNQFRHAPTFADSMRLFRPTLDAPKSVAALLEIRTMIRADKAPCLLCMCDQAARCHRSVVVEKILEDMRGESVEAVGLVAPASRN